MMDIARLTNNHNPVTWAIWSILTITLLLILITNIVIFSFVYKKEKRNVFSIKKISILASFLAFFIIQAFIFAPLIELPIPFSIDSISVIAVGFIFGPLEGIIFGWVADTLKVLIHGWSYQLLPSLLMPTIGLIAGVFGYFYKKKDDIFYEDTLSKRNVIIIFQIAVFSLLLLMFPFELCMTKVAGGTFINAGPKNDINLWFVFSATLTSFVVMQIIFFSLLKSKKYDLKILFIFTLVLIINMFDRTVVLVIRPFTQYFSGYEASYGIALYTRILSSTYLIPISTIFSFLLIEMSLYVINILGIKT